MAYHLANGGKQSTRFRPATVAVAVCIFSALCNSLEVAAARQSSIPQNEDAQGQSLGRSAARFLGETTPGGCDWPFGGSSIHFDNCHTIKNGYKFYWNNLGGTNVLVGFSQIYKGYISWGISPSGMMIKGSCVIGYPDASTGLTVNQFYLAGKKSNNVKLGGKLTIPAMSGEVVNGEIRILTNITLSDEQFSTSRVIWASGPYKESDGILLSQHSTMGKVTVGFKDGTLENGASRLEASHGFLNSIAWGLLIPLGVMSARFGKSYDPQWFYAHQILQTTGFLLAVCGFFTGVALKNISKNAQLGHFGLAILILIFSILQILAYAWRPKKDAKIRPKWNLYHHWLGRLTLILAIVNIYIGLNLLNIGNAPIAAFSLLLTIVVIAYVALEVLWFFQRRKQRDMQRRMPGTNDDL